MARHGKLRQYDFGLVPSLAGKLPRCILGRRFRHKTILNSGYLNPWYVDEVLPGDTISVSSLSFFGRLLSSLKVPVMDDIILEWWLFYCPSRILWDNWKKMQGERRNPDDSIDFLVPVIAAPSGGFEVGSIFDYMGIRPGIAGISINALPLRAYNLIFNEWFKNENLVDDLPMHYDDGPDPSTDYTLKRRMKRPDYFTSALPWTQKGDVVTIPWDGTLPVDIFGVNRSTYAYTTDTSTPAIIQVSSIQSTVPSPVRGLTLNDPALPSTGNLRFSSDASKIGLAGSANLLNMPALPITTVRDAWQVQRILERDARGGTRYSEILRSHWGVVAPDASLQRPELVALGRHYINIQQVAQTSGDSSSGNLGDLGAYGIFGGVDKGFAKSFTEHGYLIGILEIRTPLTYQQGTPALWWRRDRYDFYMPELMSISEQPVYRREIFTRGNSADGEAFGYQEPWASYRYSIDMITGKLRSDVDGSLDVWHFAQDFSSAPTLSEAFIEDNPPIQRVLTVQNEPEFLLDIRGNFRWTRQMPYYSVPGYVDHF